MRAMKASEAIGKRFRVKWSYPADNESQEDDQAIKGCIGVCLCAMAGFPYPVKLAVSGRNLLFLWRELELVEGGE